MIKYSIRGESRGKDKYLHEVSGYTKAGVKWVTPEYFKTKDITKEELQHLKDILIEAIDREDK